MNEINKKSNNKTLSFFLIEYTEKSKNKGLGSYVELLNKTGDNLITANGWYEYLKYICELRNTVHPSKIKSDTFLKNKAFSSGPENAIKSLDLFIKNIERRYL